MKIMGIEPDISINTPQSLRVFDEGHFLHLRYQLYTRDAGILCKDEAVSISEEKISIGGDEKTMTMVTGSSGRVYPFSPTEYLWLVTEPDPSRPRIAGMEEAFNYLASDLSVGYSFWLVEIPLLDRECHFGGHADLMCMDQGEEIVVDFKSKSEFTFCRLWYDYNDRHLYRQSKLDLHLSLCHICGDTIDDAREFHDHLVTKHPEWTHVERTYKIQLHIYMWLLNTNRAILVHENKSRQNVFVQDVERDEALIERIKENANILWGKVQSGEKPAIPSDYQGRKKFPCGWCDYASKCWS